MIFFSFSFDSPVAARHRLAIRCPIGAPPPSPSTCLQCKVGRKDGSLSACRQGREGGGEKKKGSKLSSKRARIRLPFAGHVGTLKAGVKVRQLVASHSRTHCKRKTENVSVGYAGDRWWGKRGGWKQKKGKHQVRCIAARDVWKQAGNFIYRDSIVYIP